MSEFNEYARRLNAIAKAHFNAITEAQEGVRKAKEKVDANPYYQSARTREALVNNAKSLAAQAELRAAEDALKEATKAFKDSMREVNQLRNELAESVNKRYLATPANLDTNTLELLKSGIMTAPEYRALMDTAIEAENSTMSRIIGKFAKDALQSFEKIADKTDDVGRTTSKYREERELLNNVVADSSKLDGTHYLDTFDQLAGVYSRTVNNDAMIPRWNELTADAIENF